MTHAGPLPLPSAPRTVAPAAPAGVWRAFVETVDPLAVSVPARTGAAQIIPHAAAVPGLSLTVGDPVWVAYVDGDRNELVVLAKR